MQIDISVTAAAGPRDLRVVGPPGAPMSELVPAITRAAGLEPSPLWVDDRPLIGGTFGDGRLVPGAVLDTRPREPGPDRSALLTLQVVGGPAAGRGRPLGRGRLVLGRANTCDLVLGDPDVSREHAELIVAESVTVRDLGSTNGTWLDGRRVGPQPVRFRVGGRLRLGDSLLALAGADHAPADTRPGPDGSRLVLRPPRPGDRPAGPAEVQLPVRDRAAAPRSIQWLSGLLPAVAGVALAWYAGSPQFLLFALLSPAMLLSTALGDRLHWRRSRRRAAALFRRELAVAERQIAAGLAAEASARRRDAPDPAAVLRIAALPAERLWSRTAADGLRVRLGTGDRPSTLRVRSGSGTRTAGRLHEVPVEVDLQAGPLGLSGPADTVDALAAWIVAQLAVHHSPAELELAFLVDPQRAAAWGWARWLPHLRGRTASSAEQWPAAVEALRELIEQRRSAARSGAGRPGPQLVVVADRAGELVAVPAWSAVLAEGRAAGVHVVCVEAVGARLPSSCRAVARAVGETGTRWRLTGTGGAGEPGDEPGSLAGDRVTDPAADRVGAALESVAEAAADRVGAAPDTVAEAAVELVADSVSPEWSERVARALAPLADGAAAHTDLPPECGLLSTLGREALTPEVLATRWRNAGDGARAVLGAGAGGPAVVDLAADGPHALVAGTTGAGKSELLQALVAGLAVAHPPDELVFLLIDYKGGAAFAECSRLPHTAGLVTDLDPYLTERALRSLHGELRRRERLLSAAGAADLAGYRARSAGPALPRLVIVVDEFATLAAELPDFVRGLVGVAQRGRSLGLHLVLATQRPGSAVSPEIRANTALRICLRVTDPAESSDVIGAPDAAALDRATPGRGFLRCGGTLSAFQAAYPSGRSAAEPDRIEVTALGPWRRPVAAAAPAGDSDLSRLVRAVCSAAEQTGRPRASAPWRPPLPERVMQSELGRPDRPGIVRMAQVDLPDELRSELLELDVLGGASLLVSGASRSGRTQALAAVALGAAAGLSPGELTIHVLDPGGPLRAQLAPLPHVATSLGSESTDLAPRLLSLLERTRAHAVPLGTDLLLIDGWDRLLAALPDTEAATCADQLGQLLRIGPGAGLAIAVSGDRSTLMPRISAGFRHRVLLRQADRGDFGLAGIPARSVPPVLGPGRGLRAEDGAVLQIALPGEDARQIADRWSDASPLPARVTVRPLPRRVRLGELSPARHGLVLGVGGDRCERLVVDPFAGAGRLVVAGPPRSGRTTALLSLLRQALTAGHRVVVAAPARSALAAAAAEAALATVTPDGPAPDGPPGGPCLLLVDDSEAFTDRPSGDRLADWLRTGGPQLATVVAGRCDDLVTAYRGVAAEARRSQCGVLLRPGPLDGELLGVRLPRRPSSGPPGRGVVVGDPAWGPPFSAGEPVPVQVVTP